MLERALLFSMMFFFFFSSRRRHTRFDCDWSSDVCSSDLMQIASEMAGFTMGEADILRRAMGKKDRDLMAKQRETFVAGCAERGVTRAKADRVWELMEKFAGYGFNKSHAAAYALVAYQTAYFKANFPVEFMAALLT